MTEELISVVVPAYNEAEVLPEFHRRLSKTLEQLDVAAEIIYVNDGSRDATRAVLEALRKQDGRVGVIELRRASPWRR